MSITPRAALEDPDLPAAELLLGPEAGPLLEAASAALGPAHGDVRTWRVSQVRYQPGEAITVEFRVEIASADGVSVQTVVASVGVPVPTTTTMLSSGDIEVAVWRFPSDPLLPGLAVAADPSRAAELLAQVGMPAGRLELRTRAYRAGRRAVVEAEVEGTRVFLKVLRPHKVRGLHRRHLALARSVPVPHSLGVAADLGIVVLQAMPGEPLRHRLDRGASPLPSPAAIVELLDRFPTAAGRHRKGAHARAGFHGAMLAAVVPDLAPRIEEIRAELASLPDGEPEVPVHGDLHVSQLLVDGGDLVGLVDVDTAGMGHRSDDLGNLVGHLAILSMTSPSATSIDAYGSRLVGWFDRLVDPAVLRRKAAASILALATGPFRVQLPDWPRHTEVRIAGAERWLEAARRLS
jgi:hypothetical protein